MILSTPEQVREYTARGYWGSATLADLFDRNVQATPDAVAVVDPANRADLTSGQPMRLTYRELAAVSDRLAYALLGLGVGKDDVVMVQLPNIVELIAVYLAAARIGAIVSPLPVQFRTHELRQTMQIAGPRVFITAASFGGFDYTAMALAMRVEAPSLRHIIAVGENLPEGVLSLDAILREPHAAAALAAYRAAHPVDANDAFTICWTSGTEAEPKGVPRSHNLWISIAYATVDGADLGANDVMLNPFPMVNMSGIGGMLVPWLLAGGRLVQHHPLNLGVFLGQIRAERVSYTVAPPVLLNMLLLNPAALAGADLSSMRSIGSGSAPLSEWMVTQWKERYNIDVTNFFGSNEGSAFLSSPQEVPDPAERARYFPRYGAPGLAWTNRGARGMISKLVNPATGEEITTPGEPGEMLIKGPTVFAGYYKRPDLTTKSFDADGFFHTGDLFAIDGEGGQLNRYRFVGRLKDLIIRGGFKIAPEEIENLVVSHPKVQDVAVIGMLNRRLNDEMVCLIVVLKKDQTITMPEIHEYLKAKDIAAYKMPRKLLVVDALPRNAVGKVLKRTLREQLMQSDIADDSPDEEREPVRSGS